jgi:Fe-S-cluster-containing dehydrogenase component
MGGGREMKQWYLIIDVAKCENCHNCLLACKDEHVGNDWPGYAVSQPNLGQRWVSINSVERGQHPMVDVAYLPVPCQHCADAPCIRAARDNAVYKRPDGIVIIDPIKAKGEKQIVAACPYGAIWWNEELQIVQKCTMCAHLLDTGWEKPRCVQACPTGALGIRCLEEAEMVKTIESEKLEAHQAELKTNPHVLYKNLYRFNRCFLGGSVAVRINGREECAEGAKVTLCRGAGDKVGECLTDNYGEFKFDNLEENSGVYTVEIVFPGYPQKTLDVDLKDSLYMGTIYLPA